MLARQYRLRDSADFAEVMRCGRRAHGDLVVLHALSGRNVPFPRFGLVVGKAVGNSVVRHRVSRRLRAILSVLVEDVPGGSDVVVRALPTAAAASSAELAASVDRALTTLRKPQSGRNRSMTSRGRP